MTSYTCASRGQLLLNGRLPAELQDPQFEPQLLKDKDFWLQAVQADSSQGNNARDLPDGGPHSATFRWAGTQDPSVAGGTCLKPLQVDNHNPLLCHKISA